MADKIIGYPKRSEMLYSASLPLSRFPSDSRKMASEGPWHRDVQRKLHVPARDTGGLLAISLLSLQHPRIISTGVTRSLLYFNYSFMPALTRPAFVRGSEVKKNAARQQEEEREVKVNSREREKERKRLAQFLFSLFRGYHVLYVR